MTVPDARSPAMSSPVRAAVLPLAAVAAGLGVGWSTAGNAGVIAGFALVLAGANGYSKAYSP